MSKFNKIKLVGPANPKTFFYIKHPNISKFNITGPKLIAIYAHHENKNIKFN